MTSKELSKLIREFVRKEIESQKAEIIKEVKAEMFDLMIANRSQPQLQTESVQVGTGGTGTPTTDMAREGLREMFASKLGMDTVNFNTESIPTGPASLPQSFTGGQVGEAHKEIMSAMNRTDYKDLMKKMGI